MCGSPARKLRWIWPLALVFSALVVLFAFDPRRHHFYPVCLFHQTTGWLCPGCGGLRAMHQLLHGHLVLAFRFNPLLLLMLAFLSAFGMAFLVQRIRKRPAPRLFQSVWLWLFLAATLVFGIWRNVPGNPFALLPN